MARAVLGLCLVICGSHVAASAWIDWQRAQHEAPSLPRPVAPGWGEA